MATNQITITFETCEPTPSGGYLIFYRPIGSLDPYREAGPFFTSPAIFTDIEDPENQQYEGFIQSDCGGGNLGNEIPFETAAAPPPDSGSDSVSDSGSAPPDSGSPSEPDSESGEEFFFTFEPLVDDYSRPFAGSYRWNENSGSQIVPDVPAPLCYYRRFTPMDFGNSASGVYDWTKFDDRVKEAINAGQTFGFGIMYLYPDPDLGGFNEINEDYVGFDNVISGSNTGHSAMPSWVLDDLIKFVGPSGDWCANYNDVGFVAYLNELHADITAHINATSYVAEAGPHDGETIQFADVIEYVDVRGVGSYGEWHHGNFLAVDETIADDFPAGYFPTEATFEAIIDSHVNNFPDWPLAIIFHVFDHGTFDNTEIPLATGEYALDQSNNWGPLGWRNDHFGDDQGGDPGGYDIQVLDDHPTRSADIMSRFETSPIIAEPPGYAHSSDCGFPQCKAPFLVDKYHYAYPGNGNYGGDPAANTEGAMQDAFEIAGHIIRPNEGSATLGPTTITVELEFQNYGSAPAYDHFEGRLLLKSGATIVWTSGVMDFDPFRFWNNGNPQTFDDTFTKPALSPGTYTLHMQFTDPKNGYRAPFPFGVEGRDGDGAYLLGNVVFS